MGNVCVGLMGRWNASVEVGARLDSRSPSGSSSPWWCRCGCVVASGKTGDAMVGTIRASGTVSVSSTLSALPYKLMGMVSSSS